MTMKLEFACLLVAAALIAVVSSRAPIKCSRLAEHNLPDPESCQHYYHCKDGVASRAKCPWYQLFDDVEMHCQKMWIVDCNAVPPSFPPPVWGPPNIGK